MRGPIGPPRLIVDAGGGRLAVLFPGERVAFSGESDADALGRVLGASMPLGDLVAFLLEGTVPDGAEAGRSPEGPGLPRTAWMSADQGALHLRRKGQVRARAVPPGVGEGSVPEGFEVRPLSELPETWKVGP